jgi:hypothetical protein
MWQNLLRQIEGAFLRLADGFLSVIPALLVLLGALLVGLVAGVILRTVLGAIFRALGARPASRQFLKAAGFRADPAIVAANFSLWAAVVLALSVGVYALEPGGLRDVLHAVIAFLPRLLTAALLFLIGLGLAGLARRSVLLTAVNAGVPWAKAAARLAHAAVVVFFAAAALEQLGVARSILVAAFSIVAGGFVFALALAFGLGARGLARRYLEKRMRAEEEDIGIRHV